MMFVSVLMDLFLIDCNKSYRLKFMRSILSNLSDFLAISIITKSGKAQRYGSFYIR